MSILPSILSIRFLLFFSYFFIFAAVASAANLLIFEQSSLSLQPVDKNEAADGRKITTLFDEAEIHALKKSLFESINNERSKEYLNRYQLDSDAEKIAQSQSEYMAKFNLLSSKNKEGLGVAERVKALGITKWSVFGESIFQYSKNKDSAESVVKKWLESSEDKNNILSKSFGYIGIGIAEGSEGTYGNYIFRKPK